MSKISYDRDSGTRYDDYRQFKSAFESEWSSKFSGSEFLVESQNMGWRNASGSGEETINGGGEFLQRLTDGIPDFSLEADFQNGVVFVTLYSHDNPTGASLEVYEQ